MRNLKECEAKISEKEKVILERLIKLKEEEGYKASIYPFYGVEIIFSKTITKPSGRRYFFDFSLMKKKSWVRKWVLSARIGMKDISYGLNELGWTSTIQKIREVEKEILEWIEKEERRRLEEDKKIEEFKNLMKYYGLIPFEQRNDYYNVKGHLFLDGEKSFSIDLSGRADEEGIEIKEMRIYNFDNADDLFLEILETLKKYTKEVKE